MGSVKVTNTVPFYDTYKSSEIRLLIIDDHQLRFNQILEIFKSQGHQVYAVLLDDLSGFEKQLNFEWDLVIFARAYDLKIQQAISLIQASYQPSLPLMMIRPEGYQANDYLSYIQRGVYELVDLDHLHFFYIAASRAIAYSRLLQNERRLGNELQLAQNHASNLVQDRQSAHAIVQEGILVSANNTFLTLFDLGSEDDVIGLPLLDLLQPSDINGFKQRFKKVTAKQFEQAQFEIVSLNSHLHALNPLKIEFLPHEEDDSLQISIETPLGSAPSSQNLDNSMDRAKPSSVSSDKISIKCAKLNELLKAQDTAYNAIVLITLAKCPELVFQDDWRTFTDYFSNTFSFLTNNLTFEVIRMESAVFVGVVGAKSPMSLQQQLAQLAKFEQPQLINVNTTTMPLNLRFSWYSFKTVLNDAQQLQTLLAQAFNQRLPEQTAEHKTDSSSSPTEPEAINLVSLTAEHIEQAQTRTPLLYNLEKSLQDNKIIIKYQQLYDKQDTNLYIYEVTAGFNDEQGWHDLNDLNDLDEDVDLSIQVDRWILVEACKQLHTFTQTHPTAKIIVNLNQHILYQDTQLSELIAKLLTIVASKENHALVLQFSEQTTVKNLVVATQLFEKLNAEGAEISIRDAGASSYTEQILKAVKVNFLSFSDKLSGKLHTEHDLEQLQQQADAYLALQPIDIVLRELNDMNMFANAWNVNARYLQGNYFQQKMDQLTDVQHH